MINPYLSNSLLNHNLAARGDPYQQLLSANLLSQELIRSYVSNPLFPPLQHLLLKNLQFAGTNPLSLPTTSIPLVTQPGIAEAGVYSVIKSQTPVQTMKSNYLTKSSQALSTQPDASQWTPPVIQRAKKAYEGTTSGASGEKTQVPTSPSQSKEGNMKRKRRTASEIVREFKCPVPDCYKCYGSTTSLKAHIKLKHTSTISAPRIQEIWSFLDRIPEKNGTEACQPN